MRGILNEFYLAIQSCLYNVVIITETWLNDNHLNTEIFDNDWNIARLDRPGDIVGGGVLVAVHNSLCSNVINIVSEILYDYEAQRAFVKISLNNK